MFSILKQIGISYNDRRLIYELYTEQVAVIRWDKEKREATIRKVVRQDCLLSPMIFNTFIQKTLNEMKEQVHTWVKIQGELFYILRYAET